MIFREQRYIYGGSTEKEYRNMVLNTIKNGKEYEFNLRKIGMDKRECGNIIRTFETVKAYRHHILFRDEFGNMECFRYHELYLLLFG